MQNKKKLVFIPTYNEKENVAKICQEILDLNLDLDILFLDDNSPDGTGAIIDDLVNKYPNVFAIHRPQKSGIGSAHIEGITWAYNKEYDVLITMDCDFTHSPNYIPVLIEESQNYDVIVGSRYLKQNSLKDWNLFRRFLTNLAHFLTSFLLKMKFDATGAFRLYNLKKIDIDAFNVLTSESYSFFFESLYILFINKYSIKEIPMCLSARTYGHSKMSMKDILKSLSFLFQIYLTILFNVEKYYVLDSDSLSNINFKSGIVDPQNWNAYWENKKKTTFVLYDIIAAFYRKFIIKRSLNHFIKENFEKDAKVLHAGCGGGQVDTDIRDFISIHALDISEKALKFYEKINPKKCEVIHGDIFDIPKPNEYFDGIYNLGVMEHFEEKEIIKILKEFNRTLKPKGKIILFWPPEYGLSVIFLKSVHFILNKVLKKNIKLHPDEPTRIRSKKQLKHYLKISEFNLIKLDFGIRDLFTYAVVVAQKNDLK